ncbi:multidrug resistance protein fnx1 [Papiliotrema laurentii]|uniref:Multidrug resistance protein fnx1 n=1 Tax=Papiliotrema laurentii TaxID=5418 RepID=A0AAD9FS55_PAPLA|nr:multidrug resistance protein fnx1 [Papiliotrema laurentii]
MSAIVIHTTPLPLSPPSPTETSPLLVSTPLSPTQPTRTTANGKRLDRSAPLRDVISPARFVLICMGIFSGNFAFAFQSTAIPTLAPGISSAFNHAELAAYLGSIFSLASAAVIPVYGVLMDSFGRAFAMDTACFFFGLGAVFCASSSNIWTLIGARAFAGLGGGGLLTVSSVIVTDLVPLRDRGLYQGIMMSIFGAGSMAGGPIAGWIADTFGWQWSFWVQLPVILFCATITTAFLPPAPIGPTHTSLLSGLASLDYAGSFLLLTGVSTLILGFSFHTSFLLPWSHPVVWGCLGSSVVLLAMFLWIEGKVEKPLVPMSLLRSRHRLSVLASGFLLSVGNQAFMFQIPMYFSVVVKTSTAKAGLILSVCGGLGLALGSLLAGQHIRGGGRYRVLGIASLFPAVAASLLAIAWTPQWPWWGYYLTLFPASLGYSVFLCCQLVALISAVDSKSMPKATALLYTVRTLGVALGVSTGGSIQIGALTMNLKRAFADHPDQPQIVRNILHSKAAINLLPPKQARRALEAYAGSIRAVWAFAGVVCVLTILCAFGMQEKEVGGGKPAEVEQDRGE